MLVGISWYLSGRDFRALQDGLSRRFRDRGRVTFGVIKNLSNNETDDLTRQALAKDAKTSLKEAHNAVLTSEDSKVAAILDAYLANEEYVRKIVPLGQQYIEASKEALDTVKELSRLDKKAAQSAIAQVASDNEKQKPQFEQLLQNGSEAELEMKNCEEDAGKYFESPPAPSEGLNKLCRAPTTPR